jgi:hypothetical protein
MKTFKEAWKTKEQEGYQYGEDALEQVQVGWDLAITEVVKWLRSDPSTWSDGLDKPISRVLLAQDFMDEVRYPSELASFIARRKTER